MIKRLKKLTVKPWHVSQHVVLGENARLHGEHIRYFVEALETGQNAYFEFGMRFIDEPEQYTLKAFVTIKQRRFDTLIEYAYGTPHHPDRWSLPNDCKADVIKTLRSVLSRLDDDSVICYTQRLK